MLYSYEHIPGQTPVCPVGSNKNDLLPKINDDEKIKKFLKDKDIKNIIFIKDKLINLIINN